MALSAQRITEEVLGLYPNLLNTYYGLHAHPELSFQEWQTAEMIAARLRSEQIDFRPIAGSGLLAKIEGRAEGADLSRAIVLRADMDALPIEEHNTLPYASHNKGVMHACGHDLHTTIVLGVITLLSKHLEELGCTIFALFQPGEELNPGGAKLVLEENPFEGYEIVAFVGNHVEPTLPTGTLGICAGKYMAACDELHFTLRGKGGHAALREGMIDPILPTAQLIEHLYALPNLAPEDVGQTIISIGKIEALGATNVVPDSVRLEGTMRTFDPLWRATLKKTIDYLCRQIEGQTEGLTIDNNFGEGYPAVYNSPELAHEASRVLGEVFDVVELGPRPTGEDFGYYTERYPSLFYRLGVGYVGDDFAEQRAGSLHTSTFCPDPKAIGIGVAAMAIIGTRLANNNSK